MTFGGLPPGLYTAIRSQVRSDTLEILATGPAAMNHDFAQVTRDDLRRSELVVLPLVLVLLLLVFGSGVAAMLPVVVGVLAVAVGLAGTLLLGPDHAGLGLRRQHRQHDRARRGHRLLALRRQPLPRGDARAPGAGGAGPHAGDRRPRRRLLRPHRRRSAWPASCSSGMNTISSLGWPA